MNVMALIPAMLSGKVDVDELAKSLGLIKRTVKPSELEDAFLKLCEDAISPAVEVIEVTGVVGGRKIRCVLVASAKQ